MNLLTIPKFLGNNIIKGLVKFLTWDLLFGTGLTAIEKLLRFFGLINFLITLSIAIFTGISLGTTIQDTLFRILLELVKSIITTDHSIFQITQQFQSISQITILQAVKLNLSVLNKVFYLLWWHRLFKYLIKNYAWTMKFVFRPFGLKDDDMNQSILDTRLSWIAFKMLSGFVVLSSILNMVFISKELTFTLIPIKDAKGLVFLDLIKQNTFNILNPLFNNWYHFIPFIGLIYYIFSGMVLQTISLILGTKINVGFLLNVTRQNITKTNIT